MVSSIALYYVFEFLASAAFNGFISVFYLSRNMQVGQISLLMALAPLTAFVSLPFWGYLADRVQLKNYVHFAILFFSCVSVLLFDQSKTFETLALTTCVFSFFSTGIMPIGETITLEILHKRGLPFGKYRLFGALSYAVSALSLGYLLKNNPQSFSSFCAIGYALCAISAMSLPAVRGRTDDSPPQQAIPRPASRPPTPAVQLGNISAPAKNSLRALLGDSTFFAMLVFALCIQTSQGVFYTLYGPYLTSVLGGTRSTLGIATAIGALCEIPFLLLADRLLRTHGAQKLLLASGIAMALHWIALSVLPFRFAAVSLQVLSVLGTTAAAFAMAQHVSLSAPTPLKARGQTLLYFVTYALARTLGSLLAGLLNFLTGSIAVSFGFTGLLLALCCFLFFRHMARMPAKRY